MRGMLQDRRGLPAPPEPREVEVHADHAHRRAPDRDIDADRAARLERREVELLAVEDRRGLAHEQGVAVPAHAGRTHAEPDRAPIAVLLEQVRGEHRGALAEAAVGLL